jgi:hypothetical protein
MSLPQPPPCTPERWPLLWPRLTKVITRSRSMSKPQLFPTMLPATARPFVCIIPLLCNMYHYYSHIYRLTVVSMSGSTVPRSHCTPPIWGFPLQPLSPFRALRACRCFVLILHTFQSDQKEPQFDPISIGFWGLLPRSMVQSARGLNFPKHNPQLLISFSYCGGRLLSRQKDFAIFAFSRGRDIL